MVDPKLDAEFIVQYFGLYDDSPVINGFTYTTLSTFLFSYMKNSYIRATPDDHASYIDEVPELLVYWFDINEYF